MRHSTLYQASVPGLSVYHAIFTFNELFPLWDTKRNPSSTRLHRYAPCRGLAQAIWDWDLGYPLSLFWIFGSANQDPFIGAIRSEVHSMSFAAGTQKVCGGRTAAPAFVSSPRWIACFATPLAILLDWPLIKFADAEQFFQVWQSQNGLRIFSEGFG